MEPLPHYTRFLPDDHYGRDRFEVNRLLVEHLLRFPRPVRESVASQDDDGLRRWRLSRRVEVVDPFPERRLLPPPPRLPSFYVLATPLGFHLWDPASPGLHRSRHYAVHRPLWTRLLDAVCDT